MIDPEAMAYLLCPYLRFQVTWVPAFAGMTLSDGYDTHKLRHSRGGGSLIHQAASMRVQMTPLPQHADC